MAQNEKTATHTSTDVPLRLRLSAELYKQLIEYRKEIGASNDQNTIRVALSMFFAGKKR